MEGEAASEGSYPNPSACLETCWREGVVSQDKMVARGNVCHHMSCDPLCDPGFPGLQMGLLCTFQLLSALELSHPFLPSSQCPSECCISQGHSSRPPNTPPGEVLFYAVWPSSESNKLPSCPGGGWKGQGWGHEAQVPRGNHSDPACPLSMWASRSAQCPSQKRPQQLCNYWFSFLPHPQASSNFCRQTGVCCKSWEARASLSTSR